jgi:vacuolar-type H+-ATPase subunit I/STV1
VITISLLERQLALITLWSVLGSFGGALILSGLSENAPMMGIIGSGLLTTGYFIHVLVNWYSGFRKQQAFVSFRWFWALVALFVLLMNLLWAFG